MSNARHIPYNTRDFDSSFPKKNFPPPFFISSFQTHPFSSFYASLGLLYILETVDIQLYVENFSKLLSIAEANFQPPSQRQPLYNQKIDISDMSSGTLSYAAANSTNCPPQALPPASDVTLSATSSPQQNMGDMAMAAATAPGDVHLSEFTSCPESNGTISGDAQYTEGLGITSSSPDIPQLDESDQVVAETKNMLVSSLLLKPYSSAASKLANADDAVASMSTPQSLQDSGNSSISPLDMLIAALDPQKSSQIPLSNKPPASILGQCPSAITCDSADGAGNGAGWVWQTVRPWGLRLQTIFGILQQLQHQQRQTALRTNIPIFSGNQRPQQSQMLRPTWPHTLQMP
ncbi:hypothetical protein BX661DRAFT_45424 [Kickxella alabastrina]|uniref:uncharacterized protein n=1 Tax=Kickxella alabastrina TaxID=61397 RepID=UPI00221FEFE9|nr:uncharacterized protein BX661DRAFT_45424 [Kickxella alabastrina]KAI7824172.1 hypothetical protein BX661DRAFT_45424 [Kickxella alabastrina]